MKRSFWLIETDPSPIVDISTPYKLKCTIYRWVPLILLATLLNTNQELISCTTHSKLTKEFHHEGIRELLETKLGKKELEIEQKKKIV